MKEVRGENGERLKRIDFAKTPVMSAYLVAFGVGSFQHISTRSNKGIDIITYFPNCK